MEEKKTPSWLQDKKKLLILIIIAFTLIVSFFVNLIIGGAITKAIYTKVTGNPDISSLVNTIISRVTQKELIGAYKNNNADEILVFKEDGEFEYIVPGYSEEGEFYVYRNSLTLTLGENLINFTIVDHTPDTLELDNGFQSFVFTKVEGYTY